MSWTGLQTLGDPTLEQSYTLYKKHRQGKVSQPHPQTLAIQVLMQFQTHDPRQTVNLLAYLAYNFKDSVQILPIPGDLSLASTPGKLVVTLVQTGQLPFLSYILGVALHSTNPPIASLLDNNWISRAIDDLPLGDFPQPWKDGEALIWLMPEMYKRHSLKIIKGHMLFNRKIVPSSNRAWGLGWK